jgi:hypothetical protein
MPGDVNRGPILNNDALERIHKRKTNLFKELITELRVGNPEILEELALERMMPGLGRSPHGCSDTGVAPVLHRCLIIILSCCIIGGLPNLFTRRKTGINDYATTTKTVHDD